MSDAVFPMSRSNRPDQRPERVFVTTLGSRQLYARRTSQRHLPVDTVALDFYTADHELVARCAAERLTGRERFLQLRPGEPQWDLGPVDIARLRVLVEGRVQVADRRRVFV